MFVARIRGRSCGSEKPCIVLATGFGYSAVISPAVPTFIYHATG